MSGSTFQSLNNQFLVAMPELGDPNFSRTVTLICQHDSNGALGVVINRAMKALNINDVLQQCSLPNAVSENIGLQPIYAGGPVHPELGLVLHRSSDAWESTLSIGTEFGLTSSRDVLKAISNCAEPNEYLLMLGYAGWGAGQLDQEIKKNAWLTVPADPRIIFEVNVDRRWSEAVSFLGVDIGSLSGSMGHA